VCVLSFVLVYVAIAPPLRHFFFVIVVVLFVAM
jgi:hypothetical protein